MLRGGEAAGKKAKAVTRFSLIWDILLGRLAGFGAHRADPTLCELWSAVCDLPHLLSQLTRPHFNL